MPTDNNRKRAPRRSKSADYDIDYSSSSSDDDDDITTPIRSKSSHSNIPKGWKAIEPTPQKHKAHPVTKNGYWSNNHEHTTNLRKSSQEKNRADLQRSPPRRVKSMPVTRKKDRKEQLLTQLSDWKTQEFSEDLEGPGMKDGTPLEKIGNAKEQVGWNKKKSADGADIASTEPFIGVNRKPKATKISEKSYKEVEGMGNKNRQVPS